MSCQCFKFFLRTIRFDNFCNRDLRLQENRLAANNELWDELVENLKKYYIPGDVIAVDEQLVGYRGRIPGRTYVPSKPRKYGIKVFWVCEAQSGFALNAWIYTINIWERMLCSNL